MKQSPAEQFAKQRPPKVFKTARGVDARLECDLLALRTKLHLSMREVSKGAGVNASQICRAEHGLNITVSTALAISKFFGVSVNDIWRPRKPA